MSSKVSFRVLTCQGAPVPRQQVIVRVCGRYEYGITDAEGFVAFPLSPNVQGKVIVQGQTRYLGALALREVLLN